MNKKIEFGSHDYEVIKVGIFNLQVCSNCPPEEVDSLEMAVREFDPAGTTGNWHIEKEGKLAPVICENGDRWHYVFSC